MKRTHLLLLFSLMAWLGFSQNMSWVRGITGTGSDIASHMAVDASGNVYTVGNFSGMVDLDPGPGTFTFSTLGSNTDAYILKLDPSGNFLWAAVIGGASYDYLESVALDAVGNVYACGAFQGTVDADPGPGTYSLGANGVSDAFMVKLDPLGNLIWANNTGGPQFEIGYMISVDAAGDVVVGGSFADTVDFDPGPGTTTLSAAGDDIFVCKFNSAGNFIWARSMGGMGNDYGYRITTNVSGDIYAAGRFEGAGTDFDPGPGTYSFTSGNSQGNGFVCKLDASGNFVWARAYQGSGYCEIIGITLAPGGDLVLTGVYSGAIDFDPGAGVTTYTSQGNPLPNNDSFVIRMDAGGTSIWSRFFTSPTVNAGFSSAVDAAGNIHTTGQFSSPLDVDPGVGTFFIDNNANYDVYVVELDGGGNFVGAYSAGSTGPDLGYTIITDVSGNFYLSGIYSGPMLFSPGFALGYVWGNEAFIAKFQGCTSLISAQPVNVAVGINDQAVFSVASPPGATYQWQEYNGVSTTTIVNGPNYSGATTASLSITASLMQNNYVYRCIVSVGSCTMVSGTATLSVYNNTGMDESMLQHQLRLSPNPAGDKVYLTSANPLTGFIYTICDQTGRMVLSGSMTGLKTEINIAGLASGLYMVQAGSWHQKLVKE